MTFCRADVRFCGRCWGESGHGVLHRICLLSDMDQQRFLTELKSPQGLAIAVSTTHC
jgi:hypothetical protein